ncbi:leukocyte elastase inhibitor-like [Paramacrobiotus metropolitanus]|uniref:leukocyte elastase inhibitor-like n=1 Tax=Paramacrobiotus metropolitanus TaxID=2943436 RepID=UPI0024459AF4|nr:leukocyte elastase inhibitor-like [Paramacrobiotus metropolitanus]
MLRLLTVLMLLLAGWSAGQSPPPSPPSPSNDVDRLRQASDRFALSLYQALAGARDANANLFFSPLSINAALLMTYLGAVNATRDELGRALGVSDVLGTRADHLNRAYSAVVDIFKAEPARTYQLRLANRICLRQDVQLRPDYQASLRQFYDTEVARYDFAGAAEPARLEMNAWVANATGGRIRNLLAPGMVSAQTLMLLLNAIYFKADWQYQFDKAATADHRFWLSPAKQLDAKMMSARRRMFYAETEQLQAVEIPYRSEELSMLLLLPRAVDGLAALERGLSVRTWQALQDQMDMRLVALTLPKFKLETAYDLVQPLRSLGINRLFGPAELDGMAENAAGLGVSDVVHKAFVEVNEEGTEAAAATGVVFSRSAVLPKQDETKELRADHPFLFAIRHNPTNLVLFLGRINDPTLSS